MSLSPSTAEIIRMHPHRSSRLFEKFLPTGYALTSLVSSNSAYYEAALSAKLSLASVITFEDDLADHPKFFNPTALSKIYAQPDVQIKLDLNAQARLALDLREGFWEAVSKLPAYRQYHDLIRFDLDQFTMSNRYSSLLRSFPGLANLAEARHFGPFNMGMVIAATIDLACLDPLPFEEFRAVRQASLLGQRVGRISNILATYDREKAEGDLSNELHIAEQSDDFAVNYSQNLNDEKDRLIDEIVSLRRKCVVVDLGSYASGLIGLHRLHFEMKKHI
jgi:hypothetical protein